MKNAKGISLLQIPLMLLLHVSSRSADVKVCNQDSLPPCAVSEYVLDLGVKQSLLKFIEEPSRGGNLIPVQSGCEESRGFTRLQMDCVCRAHPKPLDPQGS